MLASNSRLSVPPCWSWFFDEHLPEAVKREFAPKESWKNRPFGIPDARFFSDSVTELSDLFTGEGGKRGESYFAHPKFRSAYLLYFLPLHSARILSILQKHPAEINRWAHAKQPLRFLDLGSGPGTASIALIMEWMNTSYKEFPQIELVWVDHNTKIMLSGKTLIEGLAEAFPKTRGKITIKTITTAFQKLQLEPLGEFDGIFCGNALNEIPSPHAFKLSERLIKLVEPRKGSVLWIEPADRRPSQLLSQIRDQILEVMPETQIIGPCYHRERCPLSDGRDWCHFSEPAEIPGRWFEYFSKGLGSTRTWLKYHYIWLTAPGAPSVGRKLADNERLIVSDALPAKQGGFDLLLCEPNEPGRYHMTRPNPSLRRGAILKKAVH